MNGEWLTSWTIRGSLICFAVVLAGRIASPDRWRGRRCARVVWTMGFVLMLAHVVCAFHFFHDWNHTRAVEHTAAETGRLVGFKFGGGVYFNDAFMLIWGVDAVWWWIRGTARAGWPQMVSALVDFYMIFIVVNGAIIFAHGPTRWVSGAVGLLLGLLLLRRLLAKKE